MPGKLTKAVAKIAEKTKAKNNSNYNLF